MNVIDGESSKARGERWLSDVFILVVEGSHECSKAKVERGLSSRQPNKVAGFWRCEVGRLNVDTVFLQKLDCKHQIDIVRMVRSKAAIELHGTRPAANLPSVKGRCRPIFGDKNIHRTNSNIASTGAARRARGKSCELLEFIPILYSFGGRMSI